ncbi:hypothetical protein ABE073_04675 [Lederbergia citrisecunda]|uniref:hypothetical protein n=1 Tax=Lederbergia citrisecunda TaxID=2833583 RepID=UPI003D2780F9
MKKYRVDTMSWFSREYDDYNEAVKEYERTKDYEMSDGVNSDTYVELVCSVDGFDDYETIKRAVAVVDEERTASEHPRDVGYDWDYWAKWEELSQ